MKMHSPESEVASVSFAGKTFDADERGVFDVPEEAAAELLAHGLVPGEPKVAAHQAPGAPGVPPTGNPAQWKANVLEAEAKRLGIDTTLPRTDVIKAVAAARKAEAETAAAEAEDQAPGAPGGTDSEGQE